ncbi:MAG: sensor histidine kinase [Bacteroidota bacterium]
MRAAVLLVLAACAHAQEPLPLDPSRRAAPLDAHALVRADPGGSLDDVTRPSDAFGPATSLYPSAEGLPERYIARIEVASAASEPARWIVPLSFNAVTAVWVGADGQREVSRTGHDVPLAERSVPLAHPPVIALDLAAGERGTLFLRVAHDPNTYNTVITPRPVPEEAFRQSLRASDLFHSVFLGVVLALAFYNLFLFVSFRDRSYLYYVLFLGSMAVFAAADQGFIQQWLWPPDQPGRFEIQFWGLALAAISYVQFVRSYLRSRTHAPRLDVVLRGVMGVWAVCLGLGVAGQWIVATTIASGAGLLLLLMTFATGIAVHRAGFEAARYYLLAASCLLIAGLVYIVMYLVDPALHGTGRVVLALGILLEVLLLAVALSKRIQGIVAARQQAVGAQHEAEATSEALRDANALKTRLLGVAAHDLRSPLAGIVGLADLIAFETPDRPEIHELTDAIQRGGNRTLSLIQDLLVTAALEGTGIDLERRATDLTEVVREIAEQYAPHVEDKEQTLAVAGLATPLVASVDPDRFYAVVDNLVSNAVKYTPRGGRIEVACRQEGERACIRVADTGPGLSAEDQAALFEPFQPLTPSPTGGEASTGLGLSIAKELAELHGGTIEVESALGEGSAFTVVVPVREPSGVEAG